MKGRNDKPHIGIFGRRNNGKSSLINAITGQEVAIVDSTAGTTTDPVRKSIEIFGIGPCIIIDTAGIDDEGTVGAKRIQKSLEVLKIIDLAILVITDYEVGIPERQLMEQFRQFELPYLIVLTKGDKLSKGKCLQQQAAIARQLNVAEDVPLIITSSAKKQGLDDLRQEIERSLQL